ncbi:MAG: glycosyltransferase family 4 protein [bacterium]|nr:glycosyltransferase family 4 protein [bacterium]
MKEQCEAHGSSPTIVPTCIDMNLHTQKEYPADAPDRPVVIGWTGTAGNLGYMELVEDALRKLAKKHNIAVSVATGKDYELDGVEVINHRWEEAHEIDYLRDADIGLMPLLDTPYTRGKCAFKALQYMGVGTPCVISPVGMNADVIEDGVDGFVATNSDEWYDRLERLVVDAGLRREMGLKARQKVIERYSFEANYPAFKAALEMVAHGGST